MPWPRSLSKVYIVNAATKETKEFSILYWILMGQYLPCLHCQFVSIISIPEGSTVQASNKKKWMSPPPPPNKMTSGGSTPTWEITASKPFL